LLFRDDDDDEARRTTKTGDRSAEYVATVVLYTTTR